MRPMPRTARTWADLIESVNDKLDADGPCLLWRGGVTSKGSGSIGWMQDGTKRTVLVHRVAYAGLLGLSFDELQHVGTVNRTCGNNRCAAPAHLDVDGSTRAEVRDAAKHDAHHRARDDEAPLAAAAREAGISLPAARYAVKSGKVPSRKAGRTVYVDLRALREWRDQRDADRAHEIRAAAWRDAVKREIGLLASEPPPSPPPSDHVHAWRIEPPRGRKSWGECACGARREFANAADIGNAAFNA